MAEEQDPTYLPEHVGQTAGALSAVVSANGGADLTRREGPGGRRSEFMSGAVRGVNENPARAVGSVKSGGSTLRRIFAGATTVE